MSLIYNSLKQHEKKAEAVPQGNPISQRIERAQQQTPPKFFWLALFSVGFAAIVAWFGLNQYWQFQAHTDDKANKFVQVQQANNVVNRDLESTENIDFSSKNLPEKSTQFALNAPLVLPSNISVQPSSNVQDSKEVSTKQIIAKPSSIEAVAPSEPESEDQPTHSLVKAELITPKESLKNGTVNPVMEKKGLPNAIPTDTKMFEAIEQAVPHVVSPKAVNSQPVKAEPTIRVVRLAPKDDVPKPIISVTTVKRIMPPANQQNATAQVSKSSISTSGSPQNSMRYLMAVKAKVTEIKQSIKRKDQQTTTTGLHELEKLAGSDSVIFQRMNAYSFLKSHRYQQAASSYQKLLNQKPEDMEANMNLVIALSEMGEKIVAKQQLSRLDNLYPESNQVKQYKKMIKAKYGY